MSIVSDKSSLVETRHQLLRELVVAAEYLEQTGSCLYVLIHPSLRGHSLCAGELSYLCFAFPNQSMSGTSTHTHPGRVHTIGPLLPHQFLRSELTCTPGGCSPRVCATPWSAHVHETDSHLPIPQVVAVCGLPASECFSSHLGISNTQEG